MHLTRETNFHRLPIALMHSIFPTNRVRWLLMCLIVNPAGLIPGLPCDRIACCATPARQESASPNGQSVVALNKQSSIRFASQTTAQEILRGMDLFVSSTTAIDRQLRLQADHPVDTTEFRRYVSAQALDWNADEIESITNTIERLRLKIAPLRSLWPETINLVKSTGREEANAPHCRGNNAIVLPASSLTQSLSSLERLLAHELFHILSRQSNDFQTQLYAIVGFTRINAAIELPQALGVRKLTNPDAPQINCVIQLTRDSDAAVHVAPVLLSRESHYESTDRTSLFKELQFRLLVVERGDTGWAVAGPEHPTLLDPQAEPSYHRQIGRNTKYIIHPEEVLADNFVHLVMQEPDLPDRRIVDAMRRLLVSE